MNNDSGNNHIFVSICLIQNKVKLYISSPNLQKIKRNRLPKINIIKNE